MKKAILILFIARACFSRQQSPAVQDLDQIVGKEVVAQRMPLCQPGTFKIVTAYEGQHPPGCSRNLADRRSHFCRTWRC